MFHKKRKRLFHFVPTSPTFIELWWIISRKLSFGELDLKIFFEIFCLESFLNLLTFGLLRQQLLGRLYMIFNYILPNTQLKLLILKQFPRMFDQNQLY
jgi:hypothetical protein